MNNKLSKVWYSVFHPEKFHLMLYYSITSFIVMGIVSYVVGEFFSSMKKNALIERSANYAGYIATNINHALYDEFYVPAISKYGNIDLENNKEQFGMLDKVMKNNIYGLNLAKISLFDINSKVVYSNTLEHFGDVMERDKNKQLELALNGIPSSILQSMENTDLKGKIIENSLLESYYPFYEYIKGIANLDKQVGVIEICQDMAGLDIQLRITHRRAILVTSSSMGILFLILLLIVKKASNVIRLKTDQIIEARNHLEERIEERTQQIKQTYEKLQETQKRLSKSEKLAGIGTLAAGVAHEINNPLASIASCSEGLTNRLCNLKFKTDDDREVFPDYLKTISDETYRCKFIISKLLDFSRPREPILEQVEINNLLSEVVEMVLRQIDSKKHNIVLNFKSRPLINFGDYNQLKQVFLNLILNAIDATKEGGDIKISTNKENGLAQITFEDSGCGIELEDIDKVFVPFFTTKEPGKGTGLGLSICYGIIEEHKGNISVDSKGIGKGSIFTILLPLYEEP